MNHQTQPLPGSLVPEQFRLVESDDGFSQGIIPAVATASHRGFDPGLYKPGGIPEGKVLRPPIAMICRTFCFTSIPLPERLLETAGSTPNPEGVDVRDKRSLNEPAPRRHIRQVRDPKLVRPVGTEVPIDEIRQALVPIVRRSREDRGTALHHLDHVEFPHQPLHAATSCPDPLTSQLLPDFLVEFPQGEPHSAPQTCRLPAQTRWISASSPSSSRARSDLVSGSASHALRRKHNRRACRLLENRPARAVLHCSPWAIANPLTYPPSHGMADPTGLNPLRRTA